jgi:exocyst complex component 4
MLGLIYDINQDQDDEPKSGLDSAAEEARKSNSSKYSEWLMELVEAMADYEN